MQKEQSCISCLYPCILCSQENICESCHEGYLLSEGTCSPTPLDLIGTLAVQGKIYECPAGCISCDTTFQCLECGNGYFLKSNNCVPCVEVGAKCKTCNQGGCLSCNLGFQIAEKGCDLCQENCIFCNSTRCQTCLGGYYPEGLSCLACPTPGCQECPHGQCTKCISGFALFQDQCFECIRGCSWCSVFKLGVCLGCAKGYYKDGNNFCVPCPLGCSSCSSYSECTSCDEGFQLSGTQCVVSCAFPCQTCSKASAISCKSCYGGYNLFQDTCRIDNSCNTTSQCTNCPRKYFPKSGQCFPCQISNCIDCREESSIICTRCASGYALSESTLCEPCPNQCETCLTLQSCTTCIKGHFLSKIGGQSTGICSPCSEEYHCETCRSESHLCTSCQKGYVLILNKCTSQNYLGYKFTFQGTPNQFYPLSNQFKDKLIEFSRAKISRSEVSIDSVFDGSVVVVGAINSENVQELSKMAENIEKGISQNDERIGDLKVESRSLEQIRVEQDKEQEEGGVNNLHLALGVVVPLVVVIVILVVVCVKTNKDKKYQEQKQSEMDRGNQSNYKNMLQDSD